MEREPVVDLLERKQAEEELRDQRLTEHTSDILVANSKVQNRIAVDRRPSGEGHLLGVKEEEDDMVIGEGGHIRALCMENRCAPG